MRYDNYSEDPAIHKASDSDKLVRARLLDIKADIEMNSGRHLAAERLSVAAFELRASHP